MRECNIRSKLLNEILGTRVDKKTTNTHICIKMTVQIDVVVFTLFDTVSEILMRWLWLIMLSIESFFFVCFVDAELKMTKNYIIHTKRLLYGLLKWNKAI